jgi:hypothetical protein
MHSIDFVRSISFDLFSQLHPENGAAPVRHIRMPERAGNIRRGEYLRVRH